MTLTDAFESVLMDSGLNFYEACEVLRRYQRREGTPPVHWAADYRTIEESVGDVLVEGVRREALAYSDEVCPDASWRRAFEDKVVAT